MTPIERILIPIDFSLPSREALEYGLRLAERLEVPVDVLHVTTSPSYLDPQLAVQIAEGKTTVTVETLAKEDAHRRLREWLDELKPRASVEPRVAFDEPFDAIIEWARQASLLIMGTHGRRGMERWLMGSMAEKLVRHCPCPVLIHRPSDGPTPKRILVPVDFSDGCRDALELASHFRDAFDASIDLIHVVQHIPAVEGAELLVVPFEGDSRQPFEAFARERAAGEVALFLSRTRGHEGAEVRVEIGEPVPIILNAAESGQYDLIAMGTHGRSGFRRLMLGSVAERVVRAAGCPVLTVRQEEEGGL